MDSVIAKLHFSSGDIGKYNCYWNKMENGKYLSNKKNKYIFQPLEKLRIKNSSKKYKDVKLNLIKEKKFKPGLYQQANEIYLMLNKKFLLSSVEEFLKQLN